MIALKEGQWYALPSGRWIRATQEVRSIQLQIAVEPLPLWTLHTYGNSDGSWKVEMLIDVRDAGTLGVTGLLTWEHWTVADLREASPDEAEALTHRALEAVR